jgi:hypothetical protein
MPVTVILELTLKPESVPAARDVMHRALQDTRAFDGNLGTDVLVSMRTMRRTGSSTSAGTPSSTTRPTAAFGPAKLG